MLNPKLSQRFINNTVMGMDHDSEADDILLDDPETEEALEIPRQFAVVLYNDDYTPMDFVVQILQNHFNLPVEKAVDIMLNVHHEGFGVAGVFSRDIAETKSDAVNEEARQAGYPLLTKAEPC